MENFLREWRKEAVDKHQYDSAIFIGDKLLALTGDDNDAFWLAQVHFSTGNYFRAQSFLSKQDLIARSAPCKYLSAHCSIKQGKFDEALQTLGEKNPTHLMSSSANSRRKLHHANGTLKPGKAGQRPDRIEKSEERDREDAVYLKYEATMCYLRGICYAKQNSFDRAKECYKDAVRIDVQCFEAFDQLIKNSLMSPDEEWQFLSELDFDSITSTSPSSSQEAAEFTKLLYTTRLSKYKNASIITHARETLSTHYNLAKNPDILLSKAELLFTQCRFKDALSITTSILADDKYNFNIYPIHLACLHELNQKNTLFLIAHDLADHYPDEPSTWLAVGVYYLTISKVAEARRFFSKASMMDPHFGPAWIGFAHTFAAEGEHDQAISAYSTAARLFQGTHLPQLFLGMQNLQLNNMTIADEYLKAAYQLCSTDPLLLNELGVVFYHQDHLGHAVRLFLQALQTAMEIDSDPRAWVATRANLGHAYRRLGNYDQALAEFDEVLRQGGRDAGVFSAKGLVLLELGRSWEAVVCLHEALAVSPQDPVATDLLGKALEENSAGARVGGEEEGGDVARQGYGGGGGGVFGASIDDRIEQDADRLVLEKKREIEEARMRRRRAGRLSWGPAGRRGRGRRAEEEEEVGEEEQEGGGEFSMSMSMSIAPQRGVLEMEGRDDGEDEWLISGVGGGGGGGAAGLGAVLGTGTEVRGVEGEGVRGDEGSMMEFSDEE